MKLQGLSLVVGHLKYSIRHGVRIRVGTLWLVCKVQPWISRHLGKDLLGTSNSADNLLKE